VWKTLFFAIVRDHLPGTAGASSARSEATSTQSASGGGLGASLGSVFFE